MKALLAFAVVGVGTYAFRVSFIAFFSNREVPAVLARALRYVAPSVLAALVALLVLRPQKLQPTLDVRTVAALIAALVAWRTKSISWTLAAGLPALWLLQTVT